MSLVATCLLLAPLASGQCPTLSESQKVRLTGWAVRSLIRSYLTQPVKQDVEVWQHCTSGHLDDVVEGLTSVVAQPTVCIIKAGQHWFNQLLQVEPRVLR